MRGPFGTPRVTWARAFKAAAANELGKGLQEFHSSRPWRGEGGDAVQAQEERLDSVLSTDGEERR